MPADPKPRPGQMGLFGTTPDCPDVANLPLITEPGGALEVLAPGSVFQPLLLTPRDGRTVLAPDPLDANEEAFVRHLIGALYPQGDYPRSPHTPLHWQGRELWLKRNLSRHPDSFRLRVADSDWFYPDFILWILDPASRTQTFAFVDPKGLRQGAAAGWGDYKVVATLYQPHVIELQLQEQGPVLCNGETWTFRVRGVLLSTTALAQLTPQAKFAVRDEQGRDVPPDAGVFRRGRILFQQDRPDYIHDLLDLLVQDTTLDTLLQQAAMQFERPAYFQPAGEEGFDLALRAREGHASLTAFIAELLKDYLRPTGGGDHGAWAREKRRGQLLQTARDGHFGLGAEKASAIRDHPTPCEALYLRRQQQGGDDT